MTCESNKGKKFYDEQIKKDRKDLKIDPNIDATPLVYKHAGNPSKEEWAEFVKEQRLTLGFR
jgi:hypothetical protein